VDKVGQVHDAQNTALAAAGPGAKLVDSRRLQGVAARQSDSSSADPAIAVVEAEGPIQTGTGGGDLFGSTANIYSDDVADACTRRPRTRP